MQRFKLKLESKTTVAPKVFKLVLSFIEEINFKFQAGQFIAIVVGDNLKRYYSIASSPSNTKIELLVDTNPGGPGSVFFENVKEGDIIDSMGPFGQFIYKSQADAYFIATGTGLAPFRSVILDQLEKGNTNKLTLVWGLRKEENIYLQDELESIKQKYPNFNYVITLSEPSDSWQGEKGRVTHYLQGIGEYPAGTTFYLCGIKGMVVDAKEILGSKGLDPAQIFTELY